MIESYVGLGWLETSSTFFAIVELIITINTVAAAAGNWMPELKLIPWLQWMRISGPSGGSTGFIAVTNWYLAAPFDR